MTGVHKRSRLVRFRKSVKAISPTIAVLLMIAIAVVAALVAYLWIVGFLNFNTAKAGKAIQIQSVMYTGTHLVVYVQNVGESAVTFTPSQCLYVDGVLRNNASVGIDRSIYLSANLGTLAQTKTASIVDTITLSLNQKVKLKVVTNEGTWIEAYFTVYTFTGDYILTLTQNGNGHVELVPSGQSYYYETVQLNASADPHWKLGDPLWSGGGLSPNTNPQSILMDGNKAVTVTFVPITHQITFGQSGAGTDFTGTLVTIDGANYTVTELPHTFTWNEASVHNFTFVSRLSVGTDKQYVWTSTSGGISTQQSDTQFTVPNGDGTITGNYGTQFYLNVSSPYETPGGAGWYDVGATAYASLNTNTTDHGNQTRHVFTNWGGDASGTGYAQSDSIAMDGAKTALASWKTQYQVAFNVIPFGKGTVNASATDWFDEGAPGVSINAAAIDNSYKFSYWSATGNIIFLDSASDSTIATVNGPDTITANFVINAVDITITSNPASNLDSTYFVMIDGANVMTPYTISWTIGTTHTLDALSPVSGTTGTRYVFTGWSDSGSQSHTYIVPVASETVTANYKTQHSVTFDQTGLDSTASGTVITFNGTALIYGDLPNIVWADDGDTILYTYGTTVSSTATGTQFSLATITGSASPITMTGSETVTGIYRVQYAVTFAQTGLDSTASGVVVNVVVNGNTYPLSTGDLSTPYSMWLNGGDSVTYTFTPTVQSNNPGEQFILSSATGQPSPITVSSPVTVTGNYVVGYQVSFAVNPSGSGSTAPAGTNVWVYQGETITATPNSDYSFSSWSSNTQQITFVNANSATTRIATISGPGTITANMPLKTFTLTTLVTSGQGTIIRNPDNTTYPIHTVVQLMAVPANGFRLTGWSGDLTGTTNPTSITMNSDKTVTVAFVTGTPTTIIWYSTPSNVEIGQQYTSIGLLLSGSTGLNGKQIVLNFVRPDGTRIINTNTTFSWFIFDGVFYVQNTPDMLGQWTVTAQFLGDATYGASAVTPSTFSVVQGSTTTGSTLSKSSPQTVGAALTMTATVTPSAATGSIQFQVKVPGSGTWSTFDTKSLSSGSATSASYTLSTTGTYQFQAIYGGNTNYLGSTSSTSNMQVKANPNVDVTTFTPAGPITFGASVTVSVTVSSSYGTPTGTITFQYSYNAGAWNNFTSNVNLASGLASASYTPQNIGSYTFRAVYNGDSNYNSATGGSSATLTVNLASTTTTATLSKSSPQTVGAALTMTATVTPSAATGSIQFQVKVPGSGTWSTFDTKSLSSGSATSASYTLSTTGTYQFQAIYGGNTNYLGSTSSTLPMTVNQVTTTTTATLSKSSPQPVGATLTMTATVSPSAATGSVQFQVQVPGSGTWSTYDTKSLSSGSATSASYTLSTTGTYQFQAIYGGNTNYLGSTSSTLPMGVSTPTMIILRPSGNADTNLAAHGSSSNYRCVYETTADDDSTYVSRDSGTSSFQQDNYDTQDHGSASGTIISVSIYVRCRTTGSIGIARTVINTHGNDYYSSDFALTNSWQTFSFTYTNNPSTGNTWTWSEIDSLESGVALSRAGGGGSARCTQVYIVVNYAP